MDEFAEWDGLDAVVVPPDAGGYAAALEGILRRIPDGWGRGLRHERGWYRLVVDLDARLVELDPGYVVHQVKEKFGTLRFYCSPSSGPDSPAAASFEALVEEAQRASAAVCERCGSPGALTKYGGWLKTLCAACAPRWREQQELAQEYDDFYGRGEQAPMGAAAAYGDQVAAETVVANS